jgi:glutathione S-transferase
MLPILYTFRRCPYAMRARLAIKYSGIKVELREVVLADKPDDMLKHSPKGTVPVLILPDGTVLDESLDIMHWALSINDPDHWEISNSALTIQAEHLISTNDYSFKEHLDHYKYASRFPQQSAEYYRSQGGIFLRTLDEQLADHKLLLGNNITIADIAIFPFIRQFAFVDKTWFDNSTYLHLQLWLEYMLNMKLFTDIMQKYPQWKPGNELIIF